MRPRICLLMAVGALMVQGAPRVIGDAATSGAEDRLKDYRGKGEVRVTLDAAPGREAVAWMFPMEQVYRKPGTILLTLDLYGSGLRQSFLVEGSVEQSYNPLHGILVEKRFKNLDRQPASPFLAFQVSMIDLGRKVRAAKTRRSGGTERIMGYDCEILELDSKEIIQDLPTSVIKEGPLQDELRRGRTKAWLLPEYALPVRIEIYGDAPKPAMTIAFTEVKVNTGVGDADVRLNVPNGTRKVTVTADLADPEWEKKMEDELKQLLEKAQGQPNVGGARGGQ